MIGLEVTAVLLGLTNVALIVRRSVWNYPFGFAMVSLYALIFFNARLYSEAALQIFFFVAQMYGLWNWLHGRMHDGLIRVEVLTSRRTGALIVLTMLSAAAVSVFMAGTTDAVRPFWDAWIATASVTAQLLLSFRKLEAWYFWIAVDISAIGLYVLSGLLLTAGLYAVFLGLAAVGLVTWSRARSEQRMPVMR